MMVVTFHHHCPDQLGSFSGREGQGKAVREGKGALAPVTTTYDVKLHPW